jgi:hypothetical protein
MPAESRVQVRWRTLTIVLAVLLLMSTVTVIMTIALATSYKSDLPKSVAAAVQKLPRPTATVTTTAAPPTPAPLSDQVAVAFSVATGWPNSEKWGYISGYESVGDDLVVHTIEPEPADLTEMCDQLYLLNDDVIALDPRIDQVLATGVDGQVIWSCESSSEVQ